MIDPAAVAAAVDAWMHAHPYAMTALALATAHRRLVFRWVILGMLKNATIRRILLGHADDVLADVDDFRAELKDDLAEAAAADAAKAAKSAAAEVKPAPKDPPAA